MTALDGYGMVTLIILVLIFYFVRTISLNGVLGAAIAAGFAAASRASVGWRSPSEWAVTAVGLLACAFGLLIVRVMLIRSVSLHLLRAIEDPRGGTFGEDIRARLDHMRSSGLIRTNDGRIALTFFGSFVGGIVSVLYFVFRINA